MENMFKICRKCLQEKEIDLFYRSKRNKDGRFSSCKACDKIKQNYWRKNNPEIRAKARKREYLKKHHRLSIGEYEKMAEAQDQKCYICGLEPKLTFDPRTRFLQVDHCHKTKKVRKLLCHLCNRAIGFLKEDPKIFIKCISYLEEHK